MDFIVGDKIIVNKCDACHSIIGKTAKIRGFGDGTVLLSFGRGRPQTNRPKGISVDDISLVKE